jgi:hypothetical protein
MNCRMLFFVSIVVLLGGSVALGQRGRMPAAPAHRFDLAFVPLYYDYAEELPPPSKSTEYGWLPGFSAAYTYWGDAVPVYGLVSFDYAGGSLTYDGSVQDQLGQVSPYTSTSPAGVSKLQVRAGYIFKRVGGSAMDLAAYSGYGYHFWSRNIAGGPPTGYLEEYSWSYLPLGVDAEWRFGERWSIGLDLALRFMVSGSIYIERPEFGNPTLTLGNKPGWLISLPVAFSVVRNWAVFVQFGYEASAIGESNPSPPDQNGNYILEPSSSTSQFWISIGGRFQL